MGKIALTGKSSDLASDPRIIETYLGIGGRKVALA
jgi:hypothetical protein